MKTDSKKLAQQSHVHCYGFRKTLYLLWFSPEKQTRLSSLSSSTTANTQTKKKSNLRESKNNIVNQLKGLNQFDSPSQICKWIFQQTNTQKPWLWWLWQQTMLELPPKISLPLLQPQPSLSFFFLQKQRVFFLQECRNGPFSLNLFKKILAIFLNETVRDPGIRELLLKHVIQ